MISSTSKFHKNRYLITAFLLINALLTGCGSSSSDSSPPENKPDSPELPYYHEYLSTEYLTGGDASTTQQDVDAFSKSPASIEADFSADGAFKQGNALFRIPRADEGPLLNTDACQTCHLKDGKGKPPADAEEIMSSMLIRISLGNNELNQAIPDPNYGTQIQTLGINEEGNKIPAAHNAALDGATLTGEAYPFIEYEEIPGNYPDGSNYSLRKPTYKIKDAAFGAFDTSLLISPRVAPAMIGLGLLEAIPATAIEALADPNDTDNDGISGRVSMVTNVVTNAIEIGRFGWKAGTPSVLHQTAGAYRGDIGLTTSLFPNENCTTLQAACLLRAAEETNTDNIPDVEDLELASVEFYSRLLAVPERRGYDKETGTWETDIAVGSQLFEQINCDSCHHRQYVTGEGKESALGSIQNLTQLVKTNEPIAALSNQSIWPHTDLLLHDMGGSCEAIVREDESGNTCESGADCFWVQRCEGLADGRPDGLASGTEWKTPPLWGIGLIQTVLPEAGFLHDGRARTLEEAILWHGGEAQNSKTNFMNLNATERTQLLRFLESL